MVGFSAYQAFCWSRRLYQVSKGQYDRVWGYIESGKQEGAQVALGGVKRSTNGYYVDPTSKYGL